MLSNACVTVGLIGMDATINCSVNIAPAFDSGRQGIHGLLIGGCSGTAELMVSSCLYCVQFIASGQRSRTRISMYVDSRQVAGDEHIRCFSNVDCVIFHAVLSSGLLV